MSLHSSYHAVPAEQFLLSASVHDKQPQQREVSLNQERDIPVSHGLKPLIARKQVASDDAANNPQTTDLLTKPGYRTDTWQKGKPWWDIEIFSIWWLEILCCVLLTGALSAIVATFWGY